MPCRLLDVVFLDLALEALARSTAEGGMQHVRTTASSLPSPPAPPSSTPQQQQQQHLQVPAQPPYIFSSISPPIFSTFFFTCRYPPSRPKRFFPFFSHLQVPAQLPPLVTLLALLVGNAALSGRPNRELCYSLKYLQRLGAMLERAVAKPSGSGSGAGEGGRGGGGMHCVCVHNILHVCVSVL